jgi:DUF4097 and DUF4098 domain-containing protein YvlB
MSVRRPIPARFAAASLAAAIAAAVAAPAYAATSINQARPLAADGSVHIENIKGRVVVRTWAQPQVRITGSLGKGVERLEVSGSARSLDIQVKYPEHDGGWKLWGKHDDSEPTILEVTIPNRASLDVETVSADIDVQQMAGRKLAAESVSGSITVTASSPGQAEFENVSGNTLLRLTTTNLDASAVSGDIRASGGITGEVELETVSGDMELGAQALDRLDASTVSGDAILRAALRPNAQVKGETLSGELRLELPANTGARLHAETFSGDIRAPAGKVDEEEHGPGKSLDTRIGNGSADIHLESFSGEVEVLLR